MTHGGVRYYIALIYFSNSHNHADIMIVILYRTRLSTALLIVTLPVSFHDREMSTTW